MTPSLIQEPDALRALAAELSDEPWIALDTEFLRVDTYYPVLCLVQLATPRRIACVDALGGHGLAPLFDALAASPSTKVLHAARQDIEILCLAGARPPQPLVDTQVAAALAGHDEQIGYAALVEQLIGVKLGKQHTRTDWSRRPLSPEQIAYAEDDVRYLGAVHEKLHARLSELGRLEWLAEDCARLADPALYDDNPTDAWRRIGQGTELPPAPQTILRELAIWREQAARKRNLPRGWVLKDAVLVELARRAPRDMGRLAAVEGVPTGAVRKWGGDILDAIRRGAEAPPHRWYVPGPRLDSAQQALYQRLSARAQDIAEKLGLRAPVLATRQDLGALVVGTECRLRHGWRRAVLGDELLALVGPVA